MKANVLEIELFVYGNIVFGKVLFQDRDVIKPGFKFVDTTGVVIASQASPVLLKMDGVPKMFVRGNLTQHDDRTMSYVLRTKEEALMFAQRIKEAVKQLNYAYEVDEEATPVADGIIQIM